MDVRIASHHFPCFPIRRERPTVGRILAQASHFGTLPMVCVPLWVASPADRPARTPRCVKSALEQGARQNCQELASSVPGPLQFVDVGGVGRAHASTRVPRQHLMASGFLDQASLLGTLPEACVAPWSASPAAWHPAARRWPLRLSVSPPCSPHRDASGHALSNPVAFPGVACERRSPPSVAAPRASRPA